jgi:hypothetical protein
LTGNIFQDSFYEVSFRWMAVVAVARVLHVIDDERRLPKLKRRKRSAAIARFAACRRSNSRLPSRPHPARVHRIRANDPAQNL